jgi:hypothetical protein
LAEKLFRIASELDGKDNGKQGTQAMFRAYHPNLSK